MNFWRETAEFSIAIFISSNLSLLATCAFKQLRVWWRDRQWRKDISWLEESNQTFDKMHKK